MNERPEALPDCYSYPEAEKSLFHVGAENGAGAEEIASLDRIELELSLRKRSPSPETRLFHQVRYEYCK